MKKIIQTSIAAALGTLMFAIPAFAATTASFAPAQIKAVAGQQFNVTVSVDPAGTKNYAEKLEIDYPADTLEVSSFTLGNGWMALTQPGYDSTDNAKGVLVKTAGYASGIASQTLFGTILFTAKKSGTGAISIGGQSSAFQVSGQSAIVGKGAAFTVAAGSVPVIAPKPVDPASLAPVTTVSGHTVAPTPAPDAVSTAAAPVSPVAQAVAAGDAAQAASASDAAQAAASSGGGSLIYWIIGAIVIIGLIVYFMRRKRTPPPPMADGGQNF